MKYFTLGLLGALVALSTVIGVRASEQKQNGDRFRSNCLRHEDLRQAPQGRLSQPEQVLDSDEVE